MPRRPNDARLTPVPCLEAALRAWKLGLPAQTIECLRGRLKPNREEWVFWLFYGDALLSVARYAEATATARQAVRLAPAGKKHGCYRLLAEIAEGHGNMRTAERFYRRALSVDASHDGTSLVYLGGFLAKRGRLDEAADCHRLACRRESVVRDEAYLNLGYILRAQAKYSGAATCFRKALRLDPKYAAPASALRDVEGVPKARRAAAAALRASTW